MSGHPQSSRPYWFLACVFGALAGYTHILIQDSSLSVLMVTGFTMFLAYRRPRLVWSWAVLIGLSLPAAGLIAYLAHENPTRGLLIGSFAGMAFSIVAAVGGAVLHRVVHELFPKKSSISDPPSPAKQSEH